MTPVALITGASAGIGTELARMFARQQHHVVLVARRSERLGALAAELIAAGCPEPLVIPADLAQSGAAARLANTLSREGLEVEYLVNNAGFGLVGQAADLPLGEQLAMIDVNVMALTDLTLTFAEQLKRRRGGLLNVASVAGFLPGPGSAVYYASKAYVVSFSEALHAEWRRHSVRVTALCPGPVATEFQVRAGVPGSSPAWPFGVSAERVASAGYRGLMRGQRIVVPGVANLLVTQLPRILPRSTLLSLVARRQRRRRESPARSA